MNKWKLNLTCSYCSKIYKEPFELPCKDNICRQHLSERDVIKENRLKCKECNAEFGVKNNEFKYNEAFAKLIESHSYLSEEEFRLKQELEEAIDKFFEFYDEFSQIGHRSNMLFNVILLKVQHLIMVMTSVMPIQQWIVVPIWIVLLPILNMYMEQMKHNHFKLDDLNFNLVN